MDPTLQSMVYCDAVVPSWDGKLICYGLFSELKAPSFPFACPHFCLLTTWVKGSGFFTQRLKIYNPQHSVLIAQSPEMYFTLDDPDQVVTLQVDVKQVVFSDTGTYMVQIILNDRIDAEFPLRVK